MFEVKLNKDENKIEVFNISEFDFSNIKLSDPIKVEPKEYDSTLDALGLNVLIPVDDGEDFIYTYVSTNFLGDKLYSPKILIGRKYSELFSFAKSTLDWYKEVYKTGEKTKVDMYFYENGGLVSCLEQKILLVDEELFVFMEDKSDLIQVKTQKSPFEASSLPKILVKSDGTVKVNVAYESLVNAKERNIEKFTLADLDDNEILYNDTHLNLNVSDIVKKILDGEYYQIGYNMNLLNSKDKHSLVHGIARIVNYGNEYGVEFIILKELLDDELELKVASDMNLDTIQEFTKSGFVYYNIQNNTFSWGKGLENILEGPIPLDFNLIDVLDEVTISKDASRSSVTIDDITADNPFIKMDYKIKTFKGNIKYIDAIIQGIVQDGVLTKLLYFLKDVTDEVLRNYDLISIRDALNDVQSATNIGITYMDSEGNRFWTQGFYDIIEREPDEGDKYKNLYKYYLSPEDFNKIYNSVVDLGPNEYLGEQIMPITLDNGKKKYIQLNVRKTYDNGGNFVRLSEYTMDVTNEVLRNKEISELTSTVEDVQSATSISIHYVTPDGNYHWTPEYYNLLERDPRPDDKYHHILLDLLDEDDRKEINNAMDVLEPNELLQGIVKYVTLENGNKKYIQFNGRKIYDEKGNFVRKIGYAKDVTHDVLKDQELFNLRETVEDVQAAISMGIHYLSANGTYHWTPEYYSIIEREPRADDNDRNIIFDLLSDEDRKEIEDLLDKLPNNEFLGNIVKPITLENGKVKYININGRKIFDKNGKFIRESGCVQDVSESVEFEKALMKADYEKTVLIKEVHHRVKNNLQTISSFISLEEQYGTDLKSIVKKTQNRIRVLALIHEAIYAETDMKCVSIKQFIEQFDELLESISLDSDISFLNEIDDLNLNMDEITPIVLIINELTTNSFKYAFTPGKHGEIYKSITKIEKNGKKYYRFHYKDNGPGLPEDFDIDSSPSLGWSIIKALSGQLDGEYELFNKDGFNFVLEFPLIH